jgi:hypothetical protein
MDRMQSTVRAIIKAAGRLDEYEKALAECDTFHLKVHNGPWMPLTIEVIGSPMGNGQPQISVCHYREQNGDLVQDPEIVYELQDGRFIPVSFQTGAHYREQVVERKDGKILRAFKCGLTAIWAKNLRDQGFVEAAEMEGVEISC